jgi:hypothetical protein
VRAGNASSGRHPVAAMPAIPHSNDDSGLWVERIERRRVVGRRVGRRNDVSRLGGREGEREYLSTSHGH